MKNISIVLGYGIFVKPNPDYQKYLESALDDILNCKSDLVITCGGCSNKDRPDLSEADSIRTLFLELHPELKSIITTETKSLSTPENLSQSLQLINRHYPNPETVTVYCDSCRVPKVFYLCLSLFLKNQNLTEKEKLTILSNIYLSKLDDFSKNVELNYQNIKVVGIALSNSMTLISQQIISSMLEMHSFDYPDLHQQFIDWRKKKWGVN